MQHDHSIAHKAVRICIVLCSPLHAPHTLRVGDKDTDHSPRNDSAASPPSSSIKTPVILAVRCDYASQKASFQRRRDTTACNNTNWQHIDGGRNGWSVAGRWWNITIICILYSRERPAADRVLKSCLWR